ncbi:hypothetical protein [Alloactinosynnema sp. L-07]|uniref:hypothetical protein n=1 Tax=Alloactinosynnema sp. L-07 TaxID=1653480 RepID=UPI00065F06EE|nr:hypothetical protein [Alloactinosynnema sp. L-07]CRK62245.1 hypothetical protein [Alloactinosynnema sp. L-07]
MCPQRTVGSRLRAKGVVDSLPATLRVTGTLGDRTSVSMRNSAPVEEISLTVTGDRSGYLRTGVFGCPPSRHPGGHACQARRGHHVGADPGGHGARA